MAIAASSVTPTNSLEDFRIEFNNLVSDVTGITATNKFTENIIFEGATADAHETTLTVTDPTADRTLTLPNATDTIVGRATTDTLTNKTITAAIVATSFDMNGAELILDADADTSITSDTDDQIDIRIAGADDFQFTANTFTAQTGSTIAAQALTATTGVFSSDITGLTINATGDTAADDAAAIGYTSVEGLILTGQGSTNDVTIKNDADADVIEIPTGTVNVTMAGTLGVIGVVSGAGFTAGSAVLAEAELELLDGLTAGTAIASKVVTTDSSIDTTGQRNLTISGELDAATGDFSGVVDVAGALTTAAITASGIVDITNTTDASDNSGDTGALRTEGGASIAKKLYVGTDLHLTGGLTQTGGGAIFNEGSQSVDFRVESNGQTHMLFVDGSADKIGIGTSTPHTTLNIVNATEARLNIRNSITPNGSKVGGTIDLQLGENGANGSGHADTQDGDKLGVINFNGQGTDYNYQGAAIIAEVQTGNGSNDRAAQGVKLDFYTMPVSSTGYAHRWTIDQDGDLIPAATSTGIVLGATTNVASNTLDDYEEGEFDITCTMSTSGTVTLDNSYNKGSYIKIGNSVTVRGFFVVSAISSPQGTIRFNLPFAVRSINEESTVSTGSCQLSNMNTAATLQVVPYAGRTLSYWMLGATNDDAASHYEQHGAIEVDSRVSFSVNYQTA